MKIEFKVVKYGNRWHIIRVDDMLGKLRYRRETFRGYKSKERAERRAAKMERKQDEFWSAQTADRIARQAESDRLRRLVDDS